MRGEACKHGHLWAETLVVVASGTYCKLCKQASTQKFYTKQGGRRTYRKDIAKPASSDQLTRQREWNLGRKYQMTSNDYDAMLLAQDNRCAICGTANFGNKQGSPTKARVDHLHGSSIVRGLLCHNCNTALGLFGDSPEILLEAAAYLQAYKEP